MTTATISHPARIMVNAKPKRQRKWEPGPMITPNKTQLATFHKAIFSLYTLASCKWTFCVANVRNPPGENVDLELRPDAPNFVVPPLTIFFAHSLPASPLLVIFLVG